LLQEPEVEQIRCRKDGWLWLISENGRMADRHDISSSAVASGSEREHAAAAGAEGRDGSVVTEFIDAARSAAESLLEQQKRQIAERISGMAEALYAAARPLDQTQNRIVARYLEAAASQVHGLSHTMRQRRWIDVIADAEDFARRKPMLFVLGSVAAGLALGRLLWSSSAGRQDEAASSFTRGAAARSVTAAVASGPGAASGEPSGSTAARAGAAEAR
jgi:ElaB/YqjD/DUF883 family membrane-anchored ribosome-binding protein